MLGIYEMQERIQTHPAYVDRIDAKIVFAGQTLFLPLIYRDEKIVIIDLYSPRLTDLSFFDLEEVWINGREVSLCRGNGYRWNCLLYTSIRLSHKAENFHR